MVAKTKTESQEVTILDDVLCNQCGASCKSPYDDFYGLIETKISGGYNSTFLSDGVSYTFSLCEKCLAKLFLSFQTPPTIHEYLGYSAEETTQEDLQKWVKLDLENSLSTKK